MDFIPSKYQKEIFDFIEHGNGNLIIEAAAGCGKTSTLVKSINLINENKKILFCSFNTDIAKEIESKVHKHKNVIVNTVHGLGYKMLNRNLSKTIEINESKYRKLLLDNFSTLTSYNSNEKDKDKYISNILQITDLMRLNLLETENDSKEILERYVIVPLKDEVSVAIKLMKLGKEDTDTVDFTDMVWLPNVLYLKPLGCKYDFVFVDECQDLSSAQRELILKCKKINTRYIFCGDPKQCIYGFCSADINSFNKINELPNMKSLSLPISYRCADKIVEFANGVCKTIEKNNDKREGEIKFNCGFDDIQDNDMVLCSINSPLVKMYTELLKSGKKCYIRGKDIGENLKELVRSTKKTDLNVNLDNDGVFIRLYESLFDFKEKLMNESRLSENEVYNSSSFDYKLDAIAALNALSTDIKTSDELIKKIDDIFSDDRKEGIILSTIHKAKGLENNRVFILLHSLLPSKRAKHKWEIEQEENLMYVAYTRAKNFLGFLTEYGYEEYLEKDYFTPNQRKGIELSYVEYRLEKVLGRKRNVLTLEYAKEIIKDAVENGNGVKKQSFSNTIKGLPSVNKSKQITRNLKELFLRKTNRIC